VEPRSRPVRCFRYPGEFLMPPNQFLARMKRKEIAPAYLFLGAEAYQGRRCREALLDTVLGSTDRENALAQYDLAENSLAQIVDDARSLSLFATDRVIIATNAESALPRQKSDEGDESTGSLEGTAELAAYLKDPSPGVTLLFLASRLTLEGE